MDYEGVVQYALRLLAGRSCGEESSRLYDHVLVDEFQDTNRSQLELVRRLMPGESPNVFCVGDDAQSIYGFRGARIENVREFDEHFPGANRYSSGPTTARPPASSGSPRMRSPATRAARRREEQRVSSMHPGTVLYKISPSPREEGAWISDRIVELNRGRGVPFEEIAILRRSLLDAQPLVDALASRGIPMDVAGSPGAPRPATSLSCSPPAKPAKSRAPYPRSRPLPRPSAASRPAGPRPPHGRRGHRALRLRPPALRRLPRRRPRRGDGAGQEGVRR